MHMKPAFQSSTSTRPPYHHRSRQSCRSIVLRALLATTLLPITGLALLVGCDERQDQPAASAAASAPPVVTVSPEQQAYDRYRTTIAPLVEELMRMRATIPGPEVDPAVFHRLFPEVKLRYRQADVAVTPGDRKRASWIQVEKAVSLMDKGDELLRLLNKMEDEIKAEAPRHTGPNPTASTDESHNYALKLIEYQKQRALSGGTAAQAILAAGGAIMLMEADLKEGK
jgi:hypothetical protein